MIIVITGVAGLMGCHLSRFFLKKGYKVIGIDNFFGGYKDFLPQHKDFIFYERNLESDSLEDIYSKHKPKVTYHLAAYAAEGLSPFIRKFNYTNNVIASINVINECIKHKSKLIFTSSMAVYGDAKAPFTELTEKNPIDPYGIAKLCVEMDIIQASNQFGLEYNIVRPHNVVGIYQNIWDKYRNVIGIFINKILNKESLIIYGDGEQTRAFSDIKYCLPCFEKLIDYKECDVFNIGADKYFTINEMANTLSKIAKNFGYDCEIKYGEARHEVKHAYCDHSKVKNNLNFIDDTNLEELIYNLFVWSKDQPNREVKSMNYEISEGIYSYWK